MRRFDVIIIGEFCVIPPFQLFRDHSFHEPVLRHQARRNRNIRDLLLVGWCLGGEPPRPNQKRLALVKRKWWLTLEHRPSACMYPSHIPRIPIPARIFSHQPFTRPLSYIKSHAKIPSPAERSFYPAESHQSISSKDKYGDSDTLPRWSGWTVIR